MQLSKRLVILWFENITLKDKQENNFAIFPIKSITNRVIE